MNFPANTRFYILGDSIAWSTMGDDAVLVQLERDEIHVANGTGALLLAGLRRDTGASVEELTEQVLETFEIDAEAARHDVEHFIELLIRANIVTSDCTETEGVVANPPAPVRT